ncbi:MAG: aminotransferase class I/II-fold pyridoxal phosphate-dependent enzyme [Nitriliruptorales bacterium]|nr:aminotransferase class I/II-fold pyridoxal phosphate-dependent enzyme [Nitriliruptorales bacterium]
MNTASAAAVGPPPGMDVRLSSNEAPYGPSPAAIAALEELAPQAHIYPDDQSVALRQALASRLEVELEQVALGTGSAGLLMDLVAHECREGGSVLAYERGFIVYRLAARNVGARYDEAPTGGPASGDEDGYGRDPQALLDAITDDTKVVLIDNPGNPTGAHLTGDELKQVVAGIPEHVTVAIDEAYHHFAAGQRGYGTVRELAVEHPRLLVLRTFSKAYALAGLRVGWMVGPTDLVQSLDAWRVRFNVNAAGQAAALAALDDTDHLTRTIDGTLKGRRRMVAELRDFGVPVTEGLGNFVLIELGQEAAPIVEAYAEHGVGVRPLAPYGMLEQIRVTVGTPDEVDTFLDASRQVLADVASRP